jgi:hypothetical protein
MSSAPVQSASAAVLAGGYFIYLAASIALSRAN